MLVFCKSKTKNKDKDAGVGAIFSVQFHQFTGLIIWPLARQNVEKKINKRYGDVKRKTTKTEGNLYTVYPYD